MPKTNISLRPKTKICLHSSVPRSFHPSPATRHLPPFPPVLTGAYCPETIFRPSRYKLRFFSQNGDCSVVESNLVAIFPGFACWNPLFCILKFILQFQSLSHEQN